MKFKAKVSIIVPVYNEEKTLRKCLESLINQTYKNKEIVIIDDGSTDNSANIAEEYVKKYRFVKLIRTANHGIAKARNLGIMNSTGEIIFQTDADAFYAEDYIERCIKHLEDPTVGTVIGYGHAWPDNSILAKWWETEQKRRSINYKPISGWFFRRRDLEAIGYYRDLKRGEDQEICLRLKKKLGLKFSYEPSAHWWHRYPYSLRSYITKRYVDGRDATEFFSIIGTKGRTLLKSILTLFLSVLVALFLLWELTLSLYFFAITVPIVVGLTYIYPIFALKKKKLKLRDCWEYVVLSPFLYGIGRISSSLGFIVGCIKMRFK